ncbi:MAG: hypothetical protein BGP04_21660 [Rhizobiales bacterium 62-17]|nr:hypothetical protein [Hyphomicrobiales bacterium]OJY00206.1 MAG: hypothetical protein BGP04_21660 [Rhizobiales bacterium 62-17]
MSSKLIFTATLCAALLTGAGSALAQSSPKTPPSAAKPMATPASAPIDCPTQGADAIEKTLLAAPTCGASVRLLKACAFGSSADVQLAQKVVNKCEARFSRRISKQRYRAYRAAQARCNARYGKMQGTMYQSLAAICRAEAAARTARVARRR